MSVGIMASAVHFAASATFPVISSTNTGIGTLMATQTISAAPGIVAGDLLVACCSHDGSTAITFGSSSGTYWTQIGNQQITTPNHSLAVVARIANGVNDALVLVGAAQDYCASMLRVTGHGVGSVATDIKIANAATVTVSAINPPSLDAGSVKKWLWLAVGGLDQTAANQITAVPANYTAAHANLSSAASATASALGVGYRTNEVQTEDPGTFTNTNNAWLAFTVAIPPA